MTAAAPLVSVITIFLDGERFIEEAVASVFAQRYGNWELLLVDDGSRDGSTAYARRVAAAHPDRVRWLEHEGHANLGMGASRNLGLAHARGRYVALLDCDDVYLPDKLERQVDELEARPGVDLVYSATLKWFGWRGAAAEKADYHQRLGVPTGVVFEPPSLVPRFLRLAAPTPCPCSVLFRRSAAQRAGGFDPAFRGLYEDQAFFCRLLLTSRAVALDGTFDRYRQHESSACAVGRRDGTYDPHAPHEARRVFLEWLAACAERSGVHDAALRRALRGELWPYRHPVLDALNPASRRMRRRAREAVRWLRARP